MGRAEWIWESSPPRGGEGGYGAVYLLALCRDPLECDASRRRGVIHSFLIPPLNPPPSFAWGGGGRSLFNRLSSASPAAVSRRHHYYLREDRMARPNILRRRLYRPVSLLVETLSSTSLHVSTEIYKLCHSNRLSGFGTAHCNSASSSSARVLV